LFEIKTGSVRISIAGEVDIASFDLVFIRRSGKYIRFMGMVTRYLDLHKVDFVDPAFREIGLSTDKASTSFRLALKGISTPESYFCFNESVEKFKTIIVKGLKFPIIAKAIHAQRNEGIFILRKFIDFKALIKECPKTNFVFQRFINIEREYRILVLGDKVPFLEKKFIQDFKSIKVEFVNKEEHSVFINTDSEPLSRQLVSIAVESAKYLSLDIAGVDACIEKGTDRVFIIEVNRGPGMIPDHERSPELKALADYLKKRLSQ
jgi:glutathione synthase/RimK-type ligase-like ATP-grasp enzyme